MKIVTLYALFFILSTLLIILTLTEYMQDFPLSANRKETRVQKSKKKYLKRREEFIPIRTLTLAQKEIDRLLNTADNNIKSEYNMSKETLINLVKVLNNLDEEAILTISIYSDQNGSKAYNLKISQRRADSLKKYFIDKTSLPLIVAIGYGNTVVFKKSKKREHKQVEINLKRIK